MFFIACEKPLYPGGSEEASGPYMTDKVNYSEHTMDQISLLSWHASIQCIWHFSVVFYTKGLHSSLPGTLSMLTQINPFSLNCLLTAVLFLVYPYIKGKTQF